MKINTVSTVENKTTGRNSDLVHHRNIKGIYKLMLVSRNITIASTLRIFKKQEIEHHVDTLNTYFI